jgi:hypothetical protein
MTQATLDHLVRILRQSLEEGRQVHIDGLGSLRAVGHDYHFLPDRRTRVFLAYAAEDVPVVERIYDALGREGLDPWMDRRKLLAGQNWPRAIERAIRNADFFVPCFSRLATHKRGRFHAELRYALDCALSQPLDSVYILPVRLDDCCVPRQVAEHIQYVDLFPDFEQGVEKLASAMRERKKPE